MEQFGITLLKNTYEVTTWSVDYKDYAHKLEGLSNATEYSFKIKMKYDDEWYEWSKCGQFRTKHGSLGKPTIKVKGVKEDSCSVTIANFEGGVGANNVEVYVSTSSDGVVKETFLFENVSSASTFPIVQHVDGLKVDTSYTVNYKVMDNIDGDEKMYYDNKKFKTKKPTVEVEFKRVDDADEDLVDVSLLSVKNVSRKYNVILKQKSGSKIVFDEIPLTKSVFFVKDTPHVTCNVFLNDGETNHLVDKQRIFNIL